MNRIMLYVVCSFLCLFAFLALAAADNATNEPKVVNPTDAPYEPDPWEDDGE